MFLNRGTELYVMEFLKDELYHIYNRGNNQQQLFFELRNYDFFIEKVKKNVLPLCDILAYCLMPNHFHFLVYSDKRTIVNKTVAGEERNVLSEGIRLLLSSYTQAINKWMGKTGSLFQQHTKAKSLEPGGNPYCSSCFHYIHQNPMRANLVKKMELWEYSSFKDYMGTGSSSICNRELAIELLGLDMETFYEDSYEVLDDNNLKFIF